MGGYVKGVCPAVRYSCSLYLTMPFSSEVYAGVGCSVLLCGLGRGWNGVDGEGSPWGCLPAAAGGVVIERG